MTMSGIKKKRVSKKLKASWRKHANISDVEEFLEDQRLDERLGRTELTTSDDLFKIDVRPSEELLLSKKERRKLLLQQPLKCFSVLQSYTKVPDPIKKRNRVRTKEERKNVLIKNKEEENRAKGILKAREMQSIEDQKAYELKKQHELKRGEFTMNIWNDEEKSEIEKQEWVSSNTKKHNLVGIGKSRKTVTKPIKPKTSILPSIEPPHPGMSYNPSFEDHQNLLKTIADKEVKIIKEEKHLIRVTRDMFSKVTPEKRDSAWLEEMSQGLSKKDHDSDDQTDEEYKAVNPSVKNLKKTVKQRRKQKEQQKLELMRKNAKLQKKKITDIHQVKTLNKQIDKREKKSSVLREKRKIIKLLKAKEPKRLAATKFEEAEMEFNLGPDISGNLRNIKKEGNLLTDRFKSLQKRNIIEPSVRRHHKKAKVKIYTKPDHKDDWMKTVAK